MSVIHRHVTMVNVLIWWMASHAPVMMAMKEKSVMLVSMADQPDPEFFSNALGSSILYLWQNMKKGIGQSKKAMFKPLHNTHMHILLVYSDKVSTIANTFTHHQY